MDLQSVQQSEVNQKEKNKYCILTHICGTYWQGRNRGTDVENGWVGTVGEGKCGINREIRIDIYTLPCVKQIASGNLLYSTGAQLGAL